MPCGSRVEYSEPRNEKAMFKRMRASGLLPMAGPSHQEMLYKQLEKIRKGVDLNVVRDRRIQQDASINYELEMDRMGEVLRRNRVPGLRMAAAERLNANNAAAQVIA